MTLTLSSPAFNDFGKIPARHTCDGEGVSVPLAWSGTPSGAQSLALICVDPDAPGGTFHHWALFNIPLTPENIPENLEAGESVRGMNQGVNDFGRPAYGPPCPPSGHGPHRYVFRLMALSAARLDLPKGIHVPQVDAAAQRLSIGQATLTGMYER